MDQTTLVDRNIKDGKEIVQNLDKEGLFFPIAMWFFLPNSNEWRLFFGKEDVNEIGKRDYYKKIKRVLDKSTPKSGITLNDISVISTKDEIAKLVKVAVRTGRKISGIRFTGNVVNGRLISDAYIYRVV